MTERDEFSFEFFVIFDDAIVHDDYRVFVIGVRVGVDFFGRAVGRPAGVRNA